MKTLLLMRHAKSSWKEHGLEDHERPLNKRGKKDAPLMGKFIFDRELIPQTILASTAERAKKTAEAFVESSGYSGEVELLHSFYLGEPYQYIEALQSLPDEVERVMVIGHNPGLEGLLQILSGRVESLTTAAIAHLSLPIKSWKELDENTDGELVELWRPRDLKEKSK
jgi:phosphohistidine phosphatase